MSLLSQRDINSSFKKETFSNVSILSQIHPMPGDLARQVLKDDALEKPTQSLFIHLSYYLVCIVDPQKASTLPWPIYDTAAERKYRTQFSTFVVEYSKKGLLAPVMSSYFVNPACYKVTKLMFQLSELAVQRVLEAKKKLNEVKKFQSSRKDFLDKKEKALTKIIIDNINSYKRKKESIEMVAEMLRTKIIENEMLLQIRKKKLNDLVDNFIEKHSFDEDTVSQIQVIKDVNQPVPFFEAWLEKMDRELKLLESKWETNAGAFIEVVRTCKTTTQSLIQKHTGEMDMKEYTVEYNHKTDKINTKDLEEHANSEQKYVLKNIVKENKLIFPNLVRAFTISMCFIQKNSKVGDEIYEFNELLETEKRNYKEMSSELKKVLEKMMIIDQKLQPSTTQFSRDAVPPSDAAAEFLRATGIPPLPDLSDLKASRETNDESYESLPRRRRAAPMFAKPQPISLTKPYQHSRDDCLKKLKSKVSNYDKPNSTHHLSSISQAASRINETKAECGEGFTKEQLQRLFSTKKGSISKKVQSNSQRPNNTVQKEGVFNETMENNLFRSHSSHNLYKGKDKGKKQEMQLSVVQEIPTLLEASGENAIENNSGCVQENITLTLDSTKFGDSPNQTLVQRKESVENKAGNILGATENESDPKMKLRSDNETQSKMLKTKADVSMKTAQPIQKSNSIEKLIERFNKVKANLMRETNDLKLNDFHSIQEEKDNLGAVNVDVSSANNILLPDTLSSNEMMETNDLKLNDFYSIQEEEDNLGAVAVDVSSANNILLPDSSSSNVIFDDLCFVIEGDEYKNTRQSLGALLGVDETILDQYDLSD